MATESQERYYQRLRGIPKGPDSMKTRAAKAASHRADKGTPEWTLWYQHSLKVLRLERSLSRRLEEA